MQLCAHGCGMWHGWKYPNCAEALEAAIRHGFKNIEVDVSVTKDGEFVIGHEVSRIAEMDKAAFLSQKTSCGGTPLTFEGLLEKADAVPEILFFVDFHPGWRGDCPEELKRAARLLAGTRKPDHFLLEVFSERDAETVLATPFRNLVFMLGNRFRRFASVPRLVPQQVDFCLSRGIKHVSIVEKDVRRVPDEIKRLKADGATVWSLGWNSRPGLGRAESIGVDVATVDWVVPGGWAKNFLWRNSQKTWSVMRQWRNRLARRFGQKPPHGRRVFLVGVFDLLHFGHFELFRRAKALAGPGGKLTVAVQDDDFVLKYKPTANIVVPLEKRIAMIETLRTVDRVVIYTDVDEIVKELDFDIFVVGGDQTHAGFQRAIDWCKANGREVVRLSRTPGVSSSELRKGIAENR